MNTLITPLKTGKGNNLKVGRKVLDKAAKTLNKHSTPIPQPEGEEKEVAYEYGACTFGERLWLIATSIKGMLETRPDSKWLKIGRVNLADLITRLRECTDQLEDGQVKTDITNIITTFQNILTPPQPEKKDKDKDKAKGKKVEPAPVPAPEVSQPAPEPITEIVPEIAPEAVSI